MRGTTALAETDRPIPLRYGDIALFERAHPDQSAAMVAAAMVDGLGAADLRAFAREHVRSFVDDLRRTRARDLEDRAERPAATAVPPVRTDPDQQRYVSYRDDPMAFNPVVGIGNVHVRKRFRKWMGEAFEPWYEANRARFAARGDDEAQECFEADWYADGFRAYHAERRLATVIDLTRAEAQRIRLEVTRELLDSVFALGDGSRVTWGEASIEQHGARVALLTQNMAGNLETAARHQAAINMLQEAGATCLAELSLTPKA